MIGLCQRFGCLPSALLAEDAEIFRMVRLFDMTQPADEGAAV